MEAEKVIIVSNPVAGTKPIKLRSACNQCFSAKVRCDGNKSGCSRCLEKHLPCQYSESRVGKVVGKRRKRPVDDSVGMINSDGWIISNYTPPQSLPSPTATNSSDERSKRPCTTSSWASLLAADEQSPPTLNFSDDQYQHFDIASECRTFSYPSGLSLLSHSGLPTPALSPPQMQFLSPMVLEARPESRQTSLAPENTQPRPASRPSTAARTPDLQTSDDEEMVCIKLLGHLKRHSTNEHQSLSSMTNLIQKSTAAVRRILKSGTVRTDYACQLILSNIMIHIVALCENACKARLEDTKIDSSQIFQDSVSYETTSEIFETTLHPRLLETEMDDTTAKMVEEAIEVVTLVGNMLKRKPYNGFQSIGRHESLHLALEQRLRTAASFSL